MKTFFYLMAFTCLLASCSSTRDNFYFQKVKPNTTLVYDFEDTADPNFHFYWKMEVSPKEDSLITYTYDSQFKLLNKFVEVLNKDGAILQEYHGLETNPQSGRI